jgi:diphthine-ammonia ligase
MMMSRSGLYVNLQWFLPLIYNMIMEISTKAVSEINAKCACVLWSGGKDCSLAHYEAVTAGIKVKYLVTFAPADPHFIAHPMEVIRGQAAALGLKHLIVEISEPFDRSYNAGIRGLHSSYGIDMMITGDIAEVDGHYNWIRERCEGTGVSVHTPLWGGDRESILKTLLDKRFNIIFTYIKTPMFETDMLGKALDSGTLARLRHLESEEAIDPCGENGEYHTMTLDGPLFRKKVILIDAHPVVQNSAAYLNIGDVRLIDK